jgi:hypothetical protein
MDVRNIYPHVEPKRIKTGHVRRFARVVFLIAAYVCPVVNLCAGGKAWSFVVLWSLWFFWSFLFAPDLVEYNRISQTSKLIAYSCVLLILIDTLLSPGWALFVVPLISCFGILVVGMLFFSDLERQKQNSMPMLWLVFASLALFISSLMGWPKISAPMVALGAAAIAMLAACIAVLGGGLLSELKKRFHTM